MRPIIKNSTVLVTGGAGFIGSHLVDRLQVEGAKQVIVIDNLFLGDKGNLSSALAKGAFLYTEDAENENILAEIFKKHTIDIVFNCATKALNYSFLNPSDAFMTNVLVIKNLLELQRKKAFHTLCHFSSSEAYGTALYEPMDEHHPFMPTTTYAAGKAAADMVLMSYVSMFNIDSFIVRPFNNYGPRQNYRGELASVIPKNIIKLLGNHSPEIHGTGLQSRDFIYVEDTVDAVIRVYDKMPPGESVNISSDGQITIKALVEKIASLMKYHGPFLIKQGRKADVHHHNGCKRKLRSMVRCQHTSLEEGLIKTIQWYQKQDKEGNLRYD
jgi:UDP-glucose 4-epimerase